MAASPGDKVTIRINKQTLDEHADDHLSYLDGLKATITRVREWGGKKRYDVTIDITGQPVELLHRRQFQIDTQDTLI